MDNNTIINPNWAGFSWIWKLIALILLALVVLGALLKATPFTRGGSICAPKPVVNTVEKVVEVERVVEVAAADTLAPVLRLNDSAIVHVPLGSSYTDAGADAMDNIDGVGSVVVTGDVDYNIPGEYLLTYTATDKAGNTSSVTRTVIVDPKPFVVDLPSAAKLYFENDSAEFPADTELTLAAVIAYLRSNTDSTAVISGFHSATGNFQHNQDLSKQRAQSVSQLLQEAGIGENRIVLEKPVETTGSGSEEEARRVEVSIRL